MTARRVLFVNRYFHPDHSATSQMLSDLCFYLAERGWRVEVVTSRQRYDDPSARLAAKEMVRGVEVRRVWSTRFGRGFLPGRAVDYATFYLASFVALLRRAGRDATIVALTDPPLISVVAALAAMLRGAALINWTQDLFPEVAEALGMRALRVLRRVRDWSLRRAKANVALGDAMAARLPKAVVIHNWADAALHPVDVPHSRFVVGYSGNLGRAHDARTMLEAIRALRGDAEIEFVITGGGAQLDAIRAEGLPNVRFAGYAPRERLSESLSSADVHLVTLLPALEGLIVPSKFYGVLAVARPVLFVGAPDGELARIIQSHECGFIIEPGDGEGLARRIRELAGDRDRARAIGWRGRRLLRRAFCSSHCAAVMGANPDVTTRVSRLFLISVAGVTAAAAVAFFVHPPQFAWMRTSNDARALAARIASHPADWEAASALTEVALDTRLDNRFALWRAAYEQASLLAPDNTEPVTAFARDAFFHWTELSEKDKREVMAAYGPLLRDPAVFARMARPLFELTGSLSALHSAGPLTADTPATLIALALPSGLFSDYRALRGDLQKRRLDDFARCRREATPEELMAHFPAPPYHTDAEPLIRALLEELHRRPLDDNPNRPDAVNGVVDYALRHHIEPLDGLEVITRKPGAASVATQINLALALGLKEQASRLEMASNDPRNVPPNVFEWQGLCEKDLCTRAWRVIEAEHGISLTLETLQTDEVPAYAEIYVDDDLRAEGEVGAKRDFIVPAGNRGVHRIEVVLANPTTRNSTQRRLHIAGITTL